MKNRLLVKRPAQGAALENHVALGIDIGRVANLGNNVGRLVLGKAVQLGDIRGQGFKLGKLNHGFGQQSALCQRLSTGNGGFLK